MMMQFWAKGKLGPERFFVANLAGVVRKIPKEQAPTLMLQKYKQVFLGPFDIVILSLTLTLTLTIEGNKLFGKGGKDGMAHFN